MSDESDEPVGDLETGASDRLDPADDARIRAIARGLADGEFIPFLGSAASFAGVLSPTAVLPSGKGLAGELRDELGAAYPGESTDPLTVIADYFVSREQGRSRLYRYLERRFFEEQEGVDPNPTATLLARVTPLPLVVTTNYDTHVESAFSRAGRSFVVVTHVFKRGHKDFRRLLLRRSETPGEIEAVDVVKGFTMSDFEDRTVIYKMHGSVGPPLGPRRDTLVVTESDYVEFMSLPEKAMLPPVGFAEPFTTLSFLFLGYSLADWNFRVMFRRLELSAELTRGEDERRHAAILRSVGPIEREFWDRRHVGVIACSLESFVDIVTTELWP